MPNMNWSKLNSLQLGRYAEYYAKMEFASYGFEVYTSEVDDHGVDFIAKLPGENRFYEVQVKSLRDYGYIFMAKSKMPELSDERLICFLHFIDGKLPDVFVIPASAWKNLIFFTSFRFAFVIASRIASLFNSTPITSFAFLLASVLIAAFFGETSMTIFTDPAL